VEGAEQLKATDRFVVARMDRPERAAAQGDSAISPLMPHAPATSRFPRELARRHTARSE
jgi:hypothetical protein